MWLIGKVNTLFILRNINVQSMEGKWKWNCQAVGVLLWLGFLGWRWYEVTYPPHHIYEFRSFVILYLSTINISYPTTVSPLICDKAY